MIDKQKYTSGLEGEGIIREWLRRKKIHHMQADLLFKYKKLWYLSEVKHQERFEPPPFEGHGLPRWQIDARLEFQKDTGIRGIFFVVEKPTGTVFWNYIDVLNEGDYYQTKGGKPRVIFPIHAFNILEINSESRNHNEMV